MQQQSLSENEGNDEGEHDGPSDTTYKFNWYEYYNSVSMGEEFVYLNFNWCIVNFAITLEVNLKGVKVILYNHELYVYCNGTTQKLDTVVFNPLKTKCVCFIQGFSVYHAVNTLHLGYTKPIC
jgi:hypothetical protein